MAFRKFLDLFFRSEESECEDLGDKRRSNLNDKVTVLSEVMEIHAENSDATSAVKCDVVGESDGFSPHTDLDNMETDDQISRHKEKQDIGQGRIKPEDVTNVDNKTGKDELELKVKGSDATSQKETEVGKSKMEDMEETDMEKWELEDKEKSDITDDCRSQEESEREKAKQDRSPAERQRMLMDKCISGVRLCASRFPSYYKSLYRLAHIYFHSDTHKVEKHSQNYSTKK